MKRRKDGRLVKSFNINHTRHFVYGKTEEELYNKERLKRLELEKVSRSALTLSEYHEKFVEAKRGAVRESTILNNNKFFNYLKDIEIPAMGRSFKDMLISDITADDIRHVQNVLSVNHSSSTTNGAICHLSSVFRSACNERMLDFNPCDPIRSLKRTEESARDTIHRALSDKEVKLFFKGTGKDNRNYNIYRFALATGMRAGEIGALYRTDIYDGFIHVERTLTRSEFSRVIVGCDAKTASGKRRIPLNSNINEILKSQRELNIQQFGGKGVRTMTIFRNSYGKLLNISGINKDIRKICENVGIEPFTMHAFRATFATRLILAGINPRIVQELLGHKDYALTMNLYGHVLDNSLTAAMKKTSKIFKV